jgi:hypothetical protein
VALINSGRSAQQNINYKMLKALPALTEAPIKRIFIFDVLKTTKSAPKAGISLMNVTSLHPSHPEN